MKHSSGALALNVVLTFGCLTEADGGTAASLTTNPAAPGPVQEPAAFPDQQLSCVSEAGTELEEFYPSVWRGAIVVSGASARVDLTRGKQFHSHAGADPAPVPARWLSVTLERQYGGRFVEPANTGLALSLQKDGLFSRGTIVIHSESASQQEYALTCWDPGQIFGSSWTGVKRALPAVFDPASSTCLGPDGEPLLNSVPLEFVLETADGECADLRGVALNGTDLAQPLLSLNLRGANLDGASLFFASLSGPLEGARLSKLQFGYASVSGSIDRATELPRESCNISKPEGGVTTATCLQ